jgi:UDPglucose 6-dehydrogenase
MKVAVVGLWHLGSVTAACLAAAGHEVVGLDSDERTIQGLQAGQPPVSEPGLSDLLKTGRPRFTTHIAEAVHGAQIVWITYDTPVDDDDRADVDFVVERVTQLFPHLSDGAMVLVSSQLPVGSIRRLEAACRNRTVSFACSPENLRLGKAIEVFTKPDRVIVGVRREADRARIAELLRPFTDHIEWMSVESAEMTKHALNAFLATSVAFINEIATLCEQVGADAKEVERGLKSEARIGPKAYLSPGGAFAGGTLARDIQFLTHLGPTVPLLAAVKTSNDAHRQWTRRTLQRLLGSLEGRTVAVWGLTYKPGTDTLRRSSAVELCQWLAQQGARVQAHDPAVKTLPAELAKIIQLCPGPADAVKGASALVLATPWPDYLAVEVSAPIVLDPGRFLEKSIGKNPSIRYAAIGKAA